MIRFALIVASVLGFALTAALGNLMVPLLRELERSLRGQAPDPKTEPQHEPLQPVPALGGLCLMVGTLAAVGVGWVAACAAQPSLLGSDGNLMTRLLIALAGALAFGGIGLADDLARVRSGYPNGLGLRRGVRLGLEAAAAAAVLGLLALNGCLPGGLILPGKGYVSFAAAPLLWGVLLVALAECGRVADGADGTVCGAAFAAMLGLMLLETQLGWFPLAVLPAADGVPSVELPARKAAARQMRLPVPHRGHRVHPAVHGLRRAGRAAGAALLGRGRHGAFADFVLPADGQNAVPRRAAAPLAGKTGPWRCEYFLQPVRIERVRAGADHGAGALGLRPGTNWKRGEKGRWQPSAENTESRCARCSGTRGRGPGW